jgi:putative two-component system response regulator
VTSTHRALVLTDGEPAEAPDAAQPAAAVLIVDDNAGKRLAVRAMLEPMDLVLVEADSGRASLRAVLEQNFAVILMDVRMPEMDGYEAANLIRQRRESELTPIIFLTAYGRDETETATAYASGAVDFIFTPILPAVLRAKVSAFVNLFKQSQQLQYSLDSITALNVEMLARLAAAAEFRDDDTGEHTRRVGGLSVAIAQRLGVPDPWVELIRLAAPLHDLGKIAIPDSILGKPGKLTDEEFAVMRTHTTAGAEMLSGSAFALLEVAEQIALTHHEKWDGSGYPAGLAGDSIPIAGRVVAVADVFDALTHERPYKAAWSTAEAVAEIGDQAGRHFDPQVAEAFLSLSREPGRL